MSEQKTLKNALQQMSEGSKSGFRSFYLGSIQYVYSSARLLYDSHEDACLFVTDVYLYLYLHLPEYDPSGDLQIWIAKIIMERYRQLTGGKRRPGTSPKHSVSTTPITKPEQERLWHLLEEQIHFPKEAKSRRPRRRILPLVIVLLLFLLLATVFIPNVKDKLSEMIPLSGNSETADEDNGSEEDDSAADSGSADSDLDEINGLSDQLQSDGTATDSTDLSGTSTQGSGTGTSSAETPTVDTPSVEEPTIDAPSVEEPTIDTPSVEEPKVTEPSASNSTSSQSGSTEDLENLELELYYGDSLKYTDDD